MTRQVSYCVASCEPDRCGNRRGPAEIYKLAQPPNVVEIVGGLDHLRLKADNPVRYFRCLAFGSDVTLNAHPPKTCIISPARMNNDAAFD